MPDQTIDIQTAITDLIQPGEEITLAELDTRLYGMYPQLNGSAQWVGSAVTRMLRDGRLTSPTPDAPYAEDFRIARPAE